MAEPLAPATCDVPDCGVPAMPCWLEPALPDGAADEWFCAQHAAEEGYCAGCGLFSAGSETFDFSPSGLCGVCQEQARVEAATADDAEPLPWEQRP